MEYLVSHISQLLLGYAELTDKSQWFIIIKDNFRTSLVVQRLRIHLPMQGLQVRALVREDPTCRGATEAVRHNY